jgi:hypothetical protein
MRRERSELMPVVVLVLLRPGGASLINGIFVTIVSGLIAWNVYQSAAVRRRRQRLLQTSASFLDIAVCSSGKFALTTLKLMLDGLPALSTGAPARVVEHEPGTHYAGIVVDLAHPGQCVPLAGETCMGIYFGRRKPKSAATFDRSYRLPAQEGALRRALGLTDQSATAVAQPTAAVWLLLFVALIFFAVLVWSSH